jgi:diguanylate cyclase (GGDEF)-like protein
VSFIAPDNYRLSRSDDCSIFERALDALPDGVLLVNASRHILYANSAFMRLWNMPEDVFAARDDGRALRYVMNQLEDPDEFRSKVEMLQRSSDSSEEEIRFKDEGQSGSRIWIFTDVTEAKSAAIDHLTGLPNKLAYSRDFPNFVAEEQDGLVRSVALMDLDNFKKYNDLYGHAAGDRVLRQIGSLLRAQLNGAHDLLFRFGGEEFLLATCAREEREARLLFEAVRASIVEAAMPHLGNGPYGVVTASFGLGILRGVHEPDTVFERVDAALYRAKAQGRNTVVETIIT